MFYYELIEIAAKLLRAKFELLNILISHRICAIGYDEKNVIFYMAIICHIPPIDNMKFTQHLRALHGSRHK